MKTSKTTTNNEATKSTYSVKVTRVHVFDDKHIAFDAEVNGIQISGMNYIEYTTKEGKEGTMISFPQKQGKDGKWYSHCWFPISKELKEDIIKQIENLA